ncbi:MAG TPA: PHB depolymerase family esterase [Candidatus Tectomicrobia bacterium]|nr:PHB depolymerase family esterase [Candidatus Tectomicrobia bacterium]
MKAVESRGSTLEYLTVYPDNYEVGQPYPMIVCLHGRGADMRDLAGLAPAIDQTGYIYICPNAPVTISIGPGYTGRAWYEPGGNPSPAAQEQALTALDGVIRDVFAEHRVPAGQALLLGFSQGGAMTYRYGMLRPEMFAGLAILSGALRHPEGLLRHLPTTQDQRIFIAHGTHDTVVPVDLSRDAVAFLEARGYQPVYHEYPMGHEINLEVLNDLVPWMHETLPPKR